MTLAIDAHFHLWRYHARELDWISEEMGAIRRDFLADEVTGVFAAAGVRGGVAVQARSTLDHVAFTTSRRIWRPTPGSAGRAYTPLVTPIGSSQISAIDS
jgi:hypothetical protein